MTAPLAELERLLDEENAAARRADLDRLAELQQTKRGLVLAASQSGPDDEALARVRTKAAANVRLMRTLVNLLRGLAQVDAPATYQRSGMRAHDGLRTARGAL